MQVYSNSVDDLSNVAEQLLQIVGDKKIIAFFGEMGAGKTTLIKEICARLGVKDTVLSPTFSIVNEYKTEDGTSIYHFDFYRLNSLTEAYDMGYEEYLYSGNYCLIEWSEKIVPLLPLEYIKIAISVEGENERIFSIEKVAK